MENALILRNRDMSLYKLKTPDNKVGAAISGIHWSIREYTENRIDFEKCYKFCRECIEEEIDPDDITDRDSYWLLCNELFYEGNCPTEEEQAAMIRMKQIFYPK